MKIGYLLFLAVWILQAAGAQDWKWLNPCLSGSCYTRYILQIPVQGTLWVTGALQAKLEPCNYFFLSISFTSPDTGYIVGTNGKIRKTMDGGTTWSSTVNKNVQYQIHLIYLTV